MLYVIKFSTGEYWCGYNTLNKDLRKAIIYKSKRNAEDSAKDFIERLKMTRGFPYSLEKFNHIHDLDTLSYEIKEVVLYIKDEGPDKEEAE